MKKCNHVNCNKPANKDNEVKIFRNFEDAENDIFEKVYFCDKHCSDIKIIIGSF